MHLSQKRLEIEQNKRRHLGITCNANDHSKNIFEHFQLFKKIKILKKKHEFSLISETVTDRTDKI